MNKSRLVIKKLHQENSDLAYWQTQSYASRLEALETIRSEYHYWAYKGNRHVIEQRLQRICRVIKQK